MRSHTFNVIGNHFYTEECFGPIDATAYIDPGTLRIFLVVRKTDIPLDNFRLPIMRVKAGIYRVHRAENEIYKNEDGEEIPLPITWECYENETLPEGLIPAPVQKQRRQQVLRSLDACWLQ